MTGKRAFAAAAAQLVTAAGSVVGVLAWDKASTAAKAAVILVVVLVAGVGLVVEMVAFLSERPRRFKDAARINGFMHRWIAQEGKVLIFTRDMTWVSDNVHVSRLRRLFDVLRDGERQTIKGLLLKKAKRGDLIVCLPQRTELSDELEANGAQVVAYPELGLSPEARFTIVRHDRHDAQVAIGRHDGQRHRVETFAKGQHPAFALANDLARYVEAFSRSTSG